MAPAGGSEPLTNAFSVDVEDYFQVGAFEGVIDRADWGSFESRVERNTKKLLRLLADHESLGTFFFLGWVAERCPDLVREVAAAGHEIASHGHEHRRVPEMTPAEFRQDVRKSKLILEGITGTSVLGFRAPNFSVTRETLWALDILAEEGYRYDSSIFPVRRHRSGVPGAPRFPSLLSGANGLPLREFPISTVRIGGLQLPFVGGNYLRQLPMSWVRWGMRRVNAREGQPVVVYVHPWEVDPEQPRQSVGWLTRVRHYRNLSRTATRLGSLLEEFRFASMREVLGLEQ